MAGHVDNLSSQRKLITAARVLDADRVDEAPGALLLEGASIIEAGEPQKIGEIAGDGVERIHLPREIVIPALVNAHAHLDLTHIGPRPFDASGQFSGWVGMIRAERRSDDAGIEASVRRGVELSLAGGVAAVGDIAGMVEGRTTLAPLRAMRAMGMGGVSFAEVFGIGTGEDRGLAAVANIAAEADGGTVPRLGIQPHAPFSCSPAVYAAAAATGLPLATHLAETREELEFVRSGTGPLAELLQAVGVWEESLADGWDRHPVEHMTDALGDRTPIVAAHLNYIEERHLDSLSTWPITVAYCPRASAYFGHTDHAYRAMIERGVHVALGTDSMVCVDTPERISTWDEMRLLRARDGVAARTLLGLATVNGARALHMDPGQFRFTPGEMSGILALRTETPTLESALEQDAELRWMLSPRGVTMTD